MITTSATSSLCAAAWAARPGPQALAMAAWMGFDVIGTGTTPHRGRWLGGDCGLSSERGIRASKGKRPAGTAQSANRAGRETAGCSARGWPLTLEGCAPGCSAGGHSPGSRGLRLVDGCRSEGTADSTLWLLMFSRPCSRAAMPYCGRSTRGPPVRSHRSPANLHGLSGRGLSARKPLTTCAARRAWGFRFSSWARLVERTKRPLECTAVGSWAG